ncbi:phage major capsid protein [Candidatus Gottesmanbacteria bacterium]|nr:phage major capsid protein [Candidatus Gottesmanbacteria bacterium]
MGDFYSGIVDADGRYLVPKPLAVEMLKNIEIASVCQPFLRKWPMTSKTLDINMVGDEIEAGVVGTEGGEKSKSKGTFDQLTLTTKEISVIVPLTEEWSENANIAVDSFLRGECEKAIAKKLDRIYLGYENTGTFAEDISGDIPGAHIIAFGAGIDLVEDLSNALGCIEDDGFQDNIAFCAHTTLKARLRNLRDLNGRPIFEPGNAKEPATLFGYPIRFSRNMLKTGSPAAYECIVGDWMYGFEGLRGGIKYDITNQATVTIGGSPVNLWEHNMEAIKLWVRRAFRMRNVNAFAKVTGL